MKFKTKTLLIALAIFSITQSCKEKPKPAALKSTSPIDTGALNSRENKIVVDESFSPIVDEELYIFRASYDNVHPVVKYAPENNAVALFLNDSVRIAIIARPLTRQENKVLSDRNAKPMISRFAIDAVTLIVNEASPDTNITVSELKKLLTGDTKTDKNIVFDNPNSGLVRFLQDFSGAKEFKQKNIYSLKSNKEVIKYVSEHPNSIGITGFSWLNDPDKDYAADVQKVKIMAVKDDVTKNAENGYFTPSQNTLALKQYPLTRYLYLYRNTSVLGLKFDAFIMSDRGQRIILKSGLLPDSIPNRRINVIKTFKTKA